MCSKIVLFTIFSVLSISDSARILGIFQTPTTSTQSVFQAIWKELSLKGHQVTVVSPFPLRDKSLVNLTEIDVSGTTKIFLNHDFQFFMNKERSTTSKIEALFNVNYELSEAIFEDDGFKKIYQNPNERFDLIIIQIHINPIFHTLGARFNAPVIGVSSMGGYIGSHFAIGNPNHPALYSEMFLPYHGKLTFSERWYSSFYNMWVRGYLYFKAMPRCNQIARKYLGSNIPDIEDLQKDLSILFLTTNPILYEPRPNVPIIQAISQVHLKPVQPLNQELQSILDNAKNGVIYFSLGSNVQSIYMPERFRRILIETFAELPYTILWKWESEDLPNKPKNVIIKKWLPQQDILAHPNIKVFMTQCGLQSLEESFNAGVPIIGVPFIADQEMNIKRLERYGVGLEINYLSVTKEELKGKILEVANNDKYRKKVVELNSLLNDEPIKGLEKVVWWTEYVLRHNGTKHLRGPTVDIGWVEFLLLDVISVTLIFTVLCLLILKRLICFIFTKKEKLKTK
ncbi:unnamed protein product [Brassicogethes aeneus]|uniref:UDP-glucuronosyltransferase n=1 Tax=Brassicogethes aeneus TaxID=1431903 RepID=A0A9P0AV27_BRAAE|nr:unnamed protein product [Brassicogethes aeneus]